MPPGLHFRWSFAPELGFPPGGFWLCRKPSNTRGECLEPPETLLWEQGEVEPCLPPNASGPTWGQPDGEGWQIFGSPFVLPITSARWPARYPGAPAPGAPDTSARDLAEAQRRLGSHRLEPGANNAPHLQALRSTLARLVGGFPQQLLFEQSIEPSADPQAPRLTLTLMEQLLTLAVHPHLARVLGLYGVLPNDSLEPYDYCLVGRWGSTPCATRWLTPGRAPSRELEKGDARIAGARLTVDPKIGRLAVWSPLQSEVVLTPQGSSLDYRSVTTGTGLPTAQLPSALLVAQPLLPDVTAQVCRIDLPRPAGEVEVQAAGWGTVTAWCEGTAVGTVTLNGPRLTSVRLTSSRPEQQPIDHLTFASKTLPLILGRLGTRPLPEGRIGNLYAVFPEPQRSSPLEAPATPVATLKQRRSHVQQSPAGAPELVPLSSVEVAWSAPPRGGTNPMDQVRLGEPPPHLPIGFIGERVVAGNTVRLPRLLTPVSQPRSAQDPTRVHRFFDELPDPGKPVSYRVTGFNSFGVLGAASPASPPVAYTPSSASPSLVRVLDFDNTPSSGGTQSPEPSPGWRGGTLRVAVHFSGASLFDHPETRSARLVVERLAPEKEVVLTHDLSLPPLKVLGARVKQIQPDPSHKIFALQLEPVTSLAAAGDAQALLILDGRSPTTNAPLIERLVARVEPLDPQQPGGPLVLKVPFSARSPLMTAPAAFLNQSAYLIPGVSWELSLPLPGLFVPAARKQVRCRVAVQSAAVAPFPSVALEPDAPSFPSSAKGVFSAPQRWVPEAPPPPVVPLPTHLVHHEYFDPPDFHGQARISKLPFKTPPLPGDGGYLLLRAPVQALFLTDLQRRQGHLDDSLPTLTEVGGKPREDLAAWITLLPEWLSALNARRQARGLPALAPNQVFADTEGHRAFMEHFHGGLLDDELRALADIPANLGCFARAQARPMPPAGQTLLSDQIEGQGFGRVLYKLQAVSGAGSPSGVTPSAGPYYTRKATPPRPPVLFKVQVQGQALILIWTLSDDPETVAYLVYRANAPEALADPRFFGPTSAAPVELAELARLEHTPSRWPPLAFSDGKRDPRIIGVVPEPRLFARDYEGSNMAEVVLPAGLPPTEVLGVYRAAEFSSDSAPDNQPQAFNYFRPPGKRGLSQLVVENGQARLTGLRVGLGRPVEVVAVVRAGAEVRVLGALPTRRAAFYDGGMPGHPLDPSAFPDWIAPDGRGPTAYVVVAVDRYGNRSAPSNPFTVPPFAGPANP